MPGIFQLLDSGVSRSPDLDDMRLAELANQGEVWHAPGLFITFLLVEAHLATWIGVDRVEYGTRNGFACSPCRRSLVAQSPEIFELLYSFFRHGFTKSHYRTRRRTPAAKHPLGGPTTSRSSLAVACCRSIGE